MKKLYSIYDRKAMFFGSIIAVSAQIEAVRAFASAVESMDSMIYKYPNDFALFSLGEYDEHTGSLASYPTPILVHEAIEFHPHEKPLAQGAEISVASAPVDSGIAVGEKSPIGE